MICFVSQRYLQLPKQNTYWHSSSASSFLALVEETSGRNGFNDTLNRSPSIALPRSILSHTETELLFKLFTVDPSVPYSWQKRLLFLRLTPEHISEPILQSKRITLQTSSTKTSKSRYSAYYLARVLAWVLIANEGTDTTPYIVFSKWNRVTKVQSFAPRKSLAKEGFFIGSCSDFQTWIHEVSSHKFSTLIPKGCG